MKKLLALAAAVALSVSMIGCASEENPPAGGTTVVNPPAENGDTTVVTPPAGDAGTTTVTPDSTTPAPEGGTAPAPTP